MPKMDGTGPKGQGPMTGRGKGNCTGSKPSVGQFGQGRSAKGQGQGRARGLGRFSK